MVTCSHPYSPTYTWLSFILPAFNDGDCQLLLLELGVLSPRCRFSHMPLCQLVLIKARKLSIVSEMYSGRVILSNLGLSGAVILLPKVFLLNPLGYLIHRSENLFLSFFLGFSRLFSQNFSHSILPFSFHSPWKLSKS